MGGTSTDVCLVDPSGPRISNESMVTGIPVGVPCSTSTPSGRAGFDAGGLLRVGPVSAGSDPGPICFGRVRSRPSPAPTSYSAGWIRIDFSEVPSTSTWSERRDYPGELKGSLAMVEDFAAGIVRMIETSREKAIRASRSRKATIHQTYAGGLWRRRPAARMRTGTGTPCPTRAGSDLTRRAFGGGHPPRRHCARILPHSRSMASVDADLESAFVQMESVGHLDFEIEDLTVESFRSADLRYVGQGYELNIPHRPGMEAEFYALHKRRYGFANETRAIKVVNIRVRLVAAADPFEPPCESVVEGDGAPAVTGSRTVYVDGIAHQSRLYERDRLHAGDVFSGPAIISEYSSATILPSDDVLQVDTFGNLVIEVCA
jgi:N-methylhydantoinase A